MIAMLFALSSCDFSYGDVEGFGDSLSILPKVTGSTLTKAVGDKVDGEDALNENTIVTLDVFAEGVDENTFFRQYHINSTTKTISADVNNLLATNWKNEGFVAGKKYNIYVVANSDLTAADKIDGIDALKSLVQYDYDPEEDSEGGAKKPYWPDGTVNPEWLDIHKTFVDEIPEGKVNPRRVFSTDKTYLMDGVVKNWTPDATKNSQIINVAMTRAASKFIVNVKFDADFLKELSDAGESVDGEPGWRFYNFAYNAPVFDSSVFGSDPVYTPAIFSSGALLRGNASYATVDKSFTITTYSYQYSWNIADALHDAPAVVISIGYKKNSTGTISYNYYRIPIVDQLTTTSIGRNKIYKVEATVSSKGSTLLDELEDLEVNYEVIPWNDENSKNQSSINDDISYYLQVSPKNISLRGNGTQTIDIVYKKPAKQNIGILYFPNEAAVNAEDYQFGENYANYKYNGTQKIAYYYNLNKAWTTTFKNDIVQASVTDNSASSIIAVSSTSMANKAVKYIKFRVYLDVKDWESKKLYHDVTIKHLPVDNIQSIEGLWSSRTTDGWVEYSDLGQTYDRNTSKYTHGLNFYAKIYNADDNKIYPFAVSNNYTYSRHTSQVGSYYNSLGYVEDGNHNRQTTSNFDMSALTNNHMYVIQISATSKEYVLGRPKLDNNYQSDDHVVSPAFMIASQLGAVTSFGRSTGKTSDPARNAALHCGTYKEVTADGHVYDGWRLPTKEEIDVIIKYQGNDSGVTIDGVTITGNDRVMTPVLTGGHYHTLDGTNAATNYTDNNYAVRCIRDLSPDEIKALNN